MPHISKYQSAIEKKVRQQDERLLFWLFLALEAGIFFIDLSTGQLISFSPFYLLPISLSAWFLRPRSAYFFVLLSSAARVYDFKNIMPNSSVYSLIYDLLQSAFFYWFIAFLTLRIRHLVWRLRVHTQKIARNYKHQHHLRMLETTIRRALPKDVDNIIALTVVGAKVGAMAEEIMNFAHQQALALSFSQGINDGAAVRDVWNAGKSTVPIEFWVSELNGQIAGFFMVLGLDDKKGMERELHAMVVSEAYRGLGIGAAMTNFFCNHFKSRRLFAACRPDSTMMKMLKRRNFKLYATTSTGYEIIMRES